MKKKIHLISKYDSHETLCGKPIYEHDSNQVTKSRVDVTCLNCIQAVDLDIKRHIQRQKGIRYPLVDIEVQKRKRYQLAHIRNQTDIDSYY